MIQHSSILKDLKGENERLDLVLEIKAYTGIDSLSHILGKLTGQSSHKR